MSSQCRTTSLLVSKESDGRIAYKSREKSDVLSLGFLHVWPLHLLSTNSFLSLFLFSFLLFFSFFSFLISFSFHSLLIFSSPLVIFSPFWSIDRMGQKEETSFSFPQAKCMAIIIPSFFFYFIISLYDIILSYGSL